MVVAVNITKRNQKRRLKSGKIITLSRYVVQWRDPLTDKRKQCFFELRKDAEAKRNEIVTTLDRGTYSPDKKKVTVAEAVTAWLEGRRLLVRNNTYDHYVKTSHYVIGPLLAREAREKRILSGKAQSPKVRATSSA